MQYQMPHDPLEMEQREYPGELTRAYDLSVLASFLLTCPIPIGVYLYYFITLPDEVSVWSGAPWYAWLSLAPVVIALGLVQNIMISRLGCAGCESKDTRKMGRNHYLYVMCPRCRIAWKTDIHFGR